MKLVTMFAISSILIACAASAFAEADDGDWRQGPSGQWFVDWDKAMAAAKQTGRPIFAFHDQSDCGDSPWYKQCREKILKQADFINFAKRELVLLYLDSPADRSQNLLGRAQRLHNQRVLEALQPYGSTCSGTLVSVKGEVLGSVSFGGGPTVAECLKRVRLELGNKKRRPLKGKYAEKLFSTGYGALVDGLEALPLVSQADFKAQLTGVAVVDEEDVAAGAKVEFQDPEKPLEVPFGKSVCFRIEYDFPEGYLVRVRLSCKRADGADKNGIDECMDIVESWHALSTWQWEKDIEYRVLQGKGVAHRFMQMKKGGKTCTTRDMVLLLQPDPEARGGEEFWRLPLHAVNLTFLDETASPKVKVRAGDHKGAKPVADKRKSKVNDRRWQKGPNRTWFVNWDKALVEAKKSKKRLFVLHTGSDWCGWCIKLHREVLEGNKFKALARKQFVLLYLDSPQQKILPSDQQAHNEEVLEKLAFPGGVPGVVIVNPEDESVLGTISGYKPENEYLKAIKDAIGQ